MLLTKNASLLQQEFPVQESPEQKFERISRKFVDTFCDHIAASRDHPAIVIQIQLTSVVQDSPSSVSIINRPDASDLLTAFLLSSNPKVEFRYRREMVNTLARYAPPTLFQTVWNRFVNSPQNKDSDGDPMTLETATARGRVIRNNEIAVEGRTIAESALMNPRGPLPTMVDELYRSEADSDNQAQIFRGLHFAMYSKSEPRIMDLIGRIPDNHSINPTQVVGDTSVLEKALEIFAKQPEVLDRVLTALLSKVYRISPEQFRTSHPFGARNPFNPLLLPPYSFSPIVPERSLLDLAVVNPTLHRRLLEATSRPVSSAPSVVVTSPPITLSAAQSTPSATLSSLTQGFASKPTELARVLSRYCDTQPTFTSVEKDSVNILWASLKKRQKKDLVKELLKVGTTNVQVLLRLFETTLKEPLLKQIGNPSGKTRPDLKLAMLMEAFRGERSAKKQQQIEERVGRITAKNPGLEGFVGFWFSEHSQPAMPTRSFFRRNNLGSSSTRQGFSMNPILGGRSHSPLLDNADGLF